MLESMRLKHAFRLSMLGLLTVGQASAASAQEHAKPAIETHVFDVRSLLLDVPDYRAVFSDLRSDDLYRPAPPPERANPFEPAAASQPPAATPVAKPASPDTTGEKNAERIMELIMEVVDRDSWISNGGEFGSVEFYAGQLVVRQTKPAIVQIQELLDLIRAARIRKVGIEAWFVLVPAKAAEQAGAVEALTGTEFTPEEFRQGLGTKPDGVRVTRVALAGFDGQRVFVTSGEQFNVTTGLQPVVDESAIAYQPLPRQVLSGVALEVQPVAEVERGLVLLDLRILLGSVNAAERGEGSQGRREFELDTPPYQVAHLATSVSVPIGKVSRVGATRYDEERDLLIFVLPTVE